MLTVHNTHACSVSALIPLAESDAYTIEIIRMIISIFAKKNSLFEVSPRRPSKTGDKAPVILSTML